MSYSEFMQQTYWFTWSKLRQAIPTHIQDINHDSRISYMYFSLYGKRIELRLDKPNIILSFRNYLQYVCPQSILLSEVQDEFLIINTWDTQVVGENLNLLIKSVGEFTTDFFIKEIRDFTAKQAGMDICNTCTHQLECTSRSALNDFSHLKIYDPTKIVGWL